MSGWREQENDIKDRINGVIPERKWVAVAKGNGSTQKGLGMLIDVWHK